MQKGIDPWEAAGHLGMNVQTLIKHYGHHHPNYMKGAVEGITGKPKGEQNKMVSVGISGGKKKAADQTA